MIDRRTFVALAATAAATAPGRAGALASGASRKREVREFRGFAEATHPRGREASADGDWRRRWDALEAAADRLNDGAYFIGLRRGLGWFADGHTTVLPFEFVGGVPEALKAGPFAQTLPLRVQLFHDGAFVTAASGGQRDLLGQRVERVGSQSSIELVRAHAADWSGNKAWAQNWAASAFTSPALLLGFGAIADPTAAVSFGLASAGRTVIPIAASFADRVEIERRSPEHENWAKAAGAGNYVRPLPDRRALYVSIDDMADVDGMTFEQLTRDAFAAMDAPAVDRVIIDLRRNGGGNNYLGEPLRKRLAASRFNRPGGLYVLTGPRTFSAAQNLANRLERETFALFVGEPTGGSPNHYGDAKPFAGKATGITAIVSTIPWFDSYPQDRRHWIMPDLLVPERFEDWRTGRDMALDVVLAQPSPTAADFLNRERLFYFSRPSQAAEWKPFWV